MNISAREHVAIMTSQLCSPVCYTEAGQSRVLDVRQNTTAVQQIPANTGRFVR